MTTTLKNQKLCMTGLAAILAVTTFVGGAQAATPMGVATTAEKIAQAAEARFQSQVKQGYLDIANYAVARAGRKEIAEYFRTKAETAQNQGFINPENPEYLVTLSGVNIGEARSKLVSYLTAEQIQKNPEAAAAALINFDCFVSEIDLKDETCLQNFAISLASLTPANTSMGAPEVDLAPTEPSMPSDPEIPDRVTYNPPGATTPTMPPAPAEPPKNPPNHHPDPEYPNPHDPEEPNPHDPYPGHPPTFPDGIGDATDGNDHPWQTAGNSGHGEGSGGYDASNRDSGPSTSDQGSSQGGASDSKDKGDDKGDNNDGVGQND